MNWKKIICLFLALLLFPVVSLADLPDISGLTRDELIELSHLISNALFDQSLPYGVLMPAGDYIIGVDIPAGDYRADTVSDVGGSISVYRSKEEAEKHAMSYISELYLGEMWGTLVFRLTLEEGYYVRLRSNSLKLYPYAGLVDLSIPKE